MRPNRRPYLLDRKGALVLRWVQVMILVLGTSACATRQLMVTEVVSLVENGLSAYETDRDLDLVEKSMPANIKLLETLLASDPHNVELLTLLARLYGSYAFAFAEPDLEALLLKRARVDIPLTRDEARRLQRLENAVSTYYLRGAGYARRALAVRHPDGPRALDRIDQARAFVESLSKTDVPALFWYGFNQGLYVNRNLDSVEALSTAHGVEQVMQRILHLNREYYHGGAYLVLMAYYGSRPRMMGGDPGRALKYYQELQALSRDKFLLADVFLARYYFYPRQERSRFEETLREVLEPSESAADLALLNAVAGRKAAVYLGGVGVLFAE